MKKWAVMTVMAILLAGCGVKTNYATDEPFIIVTHSPAGPDDFRNMYARNYAVFNDGTLRLYTESDGQLMLGEDAPVFEEVLEQAAVEKVKRAIEKNKFWKLQEDVSVDSEDGTFLYITVNLTDDSKKVGGLNPNHPGFMKIREAVTDLVETEDYRAWTEAIEAHILEMNP